jgi:predicted transcriptional regulator
MKILNSLLSLSLLSAGLTVPACANTEDTSSNSTEPRSGESAGDLHGTVFEIAGADIPKDKLHAIAQAVEQKTGAHMAKVAVQKGEEDMHVMIEVWTPGAVDAGLEEALRGEFSELAAAEITRADLGVGGPDMTADGDGPMAAGHVDIDPDDDPETIRQKVIEDLRAKGVEGEIKVEVIDMGDGKRGVKVEVEDERHQ